MWDHIDTQRQCLFFENILTDNTFSSGARNLLLVAASLYNQDTSINLYSVLGYLDDDGLALAFRAINTFTVDNWQPPGRSPVPPFTLG